MSEYSEELRRILWNRLTKISGKDPKSYRLDAAGALIEWDEYGNYSPNGWQVDHAFPKNKLKENGIKEENWDDIVDLRPFNSANNDLKNDNFPIYIRAVYYDVHADKNVVDGKTNYIVNREVQKNIQKHYQLPLYLFGDRNIIATLPRKKY